MKQKAQKMAVRALQNEITQERMAARKKMVKKILVSK
jgi:hypothetical protein